MRSFVKIKSSRNRRFILPFTDEGKSCHSREFYVANMSFNAIRDNKILAKVSEFTVSVPLQYFYVRFQSFCVISIFYHMTSRLGVK